MKEKEVGNGNILEIEDAEDVRLPVSGPLLPKDLKNEFLSPAEDDISFSSELMSPFSERAADDVGDGDDSSIAGGVGHFSVKLYKGQNWI